MISVANDADVRNVFTAYVESAISRCKTRYLYKKYEYEKEMLLLDKLEWDKFVDTTELVPFSFDEMDEESIIDSIENDNLLISVLKLSEKERKILNVHAVYKMKHSEIADILEMSQSSVQKSYQRTIAKIKNDMRGGFNEKF